MRHIIAQPEADCIRPAIHSVIIKMVKEPAFQYMKKPAIRLDGRGIIRVQSGSQHRV
jgi:hypothetical protein